MLRVPAHYDTLSQYTRTNTTLTSKSYHSRRWGWCITITAHCSTPLNSALLRVWIKLWCSDAECNLRCGLLHLLSFKHLLWVMLRGRWRITWIASSVQRESCFNFRDGIENICLSISCPRRDREFLSSSLMLRDEIEIFFLSISCFETRSRISFFQSRASRRAWEFFHLISGFETRARNSVISSQFSRRERDFFLAFIFV